VKKKNQRRPTKLTSNLIRIINVASHWIDGFGPCQRGVNRPEITQVSRSWSHQTIISILRVVLGRLVARFLPTQWQPWRRSDSFRRRRSWWRRNNRSTQRERRDGNIFQTRRKSIGHLDCSRRGNHKKHVSVEIFLLAQQHSRKEYHQPGEADNPGGRGGIQPVKLADIRARREFGDRGGSPFRRRIFSNRRFSLRCSLRSSFLAFSRSAELCHDQINVIITKISPKASIEPKIMAIIYPTEFEKSNVNGFTWPCGFPFTSHSGTCIGGMGGGP